MKTTRIAMLTVLALAATAQIARAEMTRPVRPDLLAAQQTVAWRAQNSKGAQREALNSEERKLDVASEVAPLEQKLFALTPPGVFASLGSFPKCSGVGMEQRPGAHSSFHRFVRRAVAEWSAVGA